MMTGTNHDADQSLRGINPRAIVNQVFYSARLRGLPLNQTKHPRYLLLSDNRWLLCQATLRVLNQTMPAPHLARRVWRRLPSVQVCAGAIHRYHGAQTRQLGYPKYVAAKYTSQGGHRPYSQYDFDPIQAPS